jgi:DNA-binding response OmpR family regulator
MSAVCCGEKAFHAPVIMLTALDGDADTVLGLDSGANDYVTKPFRLGVLLARLRTHIRRHEMSEDASLNVGPFMFRPSIKALQRNDGRKNISLSDKENAILKQLYRAGDSAVTCEAPYADIWDHSTALMMRTLQTHIYRLRQKIEGNPSEPQILLSEHGGYRLTR